MCFVLAELWASTFLEDLAWGVTMELLFVCATAMHGIWVRVSFSCAFTAHTNFCGAVGASVSFLLPLEVRHCPRFGMIRSNWPFVIFNDWSRGSYDQPFLRKTDASYGVCFGLLFLLGEVVGTMFVCDLAPMTSARRADTDTL